MKYISTNFHRLPRYQLMVMTLFMLSAYSNLLAQNCDVNPPTNIKVSDVTNTTATITWTSTTKSHFYIADKALGGTWSPWIKVGADTSYTFTGLTPDTRYNFKLQAGCKDGTRSDIVNVDTKTLSTSKPNIIFVIIDDARFDYFSINGAPPFYQSPNIDRIAKEGVNFRSCYVPTSLCSPSRSTIATGLFTLKTGINYNGELLDTNFVTIPEVLGPNGYYTAMIGKNHGQFFNGSIPEYDFWMISKHLDNNDGERFDYNGTNKTIKKEYVLTCTDTAIALIQRTSQPLFLWLAYQMPHFPSVILPWDIGLYDNAGPIPFGPDTAKYTENVPSFLYDTQDENFLHGYALDSTYRDVLEEMVGLDSCIGVILNTLQSTGKLDNTMVIFLSDNGFCLGNHWLDDKTYAYEPSMKIPLFIRYPAWFPAGTVITSQFASNMDIAATMYDAAGITKGIPQMDGFSLRKLYNGTASRTSVYYLKEHDSTGRSPTVRAFRDRYYKYIFHACDADTVEEFFDEVHDSLELTNLVNDKSSQKVLKQYRQKYDSMKKAWNDTAAALIKPCYIDNPVASRLWLDDEDDMPSDPVIYPTITSGPLEVYIPWNTAEVELFDGTGRLLTYWNLADRISRIELPSLVSGMYFMQFRSNGELITKKVIVQSHY